MPAAARKLSNSRSIRTRTSSPYSDFPLSLSYRLSQTLPFQPPSTVIIADELVPTSYVLDKIPLFGKDICNNFVVADTLLWVHTIGNPDRSPEVFCTQSLYIILQSSLCNKMLSHLYQKVTVATEAQQEHADEEIKLPSESYGFALKLFLPCSISFRLLFTWMHTHDDGMVLRTLREYPRLIEGFVRNAIAIGIDTNGLELCWKLIEMLPTRYHT